MDCPPPRKARRSSILSQAAQREGYDATMEKSLLDLAKQMPASAVSNAVRLSGTHRRSSAASGISSEILPTPVNKMHPASRGGSASKGISSIPRPMSSRGKKQPISLPRSENRSNRSRFEAFGQSAILSHPGPKSRRSRSRDEGRPTARPLTLPRSNSVECLSVQTPVSGLCMTPRSGFSSSNRFMKSPASAATINFPDKTDILKNMKPPGHKDGQGLSRIANIVRTFMMNNLCPQNIMLELGKKMSLSQYLDACRFVLQHMFGHKFLQNMKQEDLSNKLLALSSEFNYPGGLTKSVLKSPNSDHAWPAALSFLAYLCCRVEAALTPVETKGVDPINEIKDPDSYTKVVLFEALRRLFCQSITSAGETQLNEEKEAYKERVREMKNKPPRMNALLAELEEVNNRFAARGGEGDCRGDLPAIHKAQLANLETLKQQVADLQENFDKFSDLEAVETRYTTLVASLESAKVENENLDETIATQKVDISRRKELLKEIENLKSQREVVKQVNESTKRALQNREQYMANAQHRFYDVCCRLNVANVFNEHLQKLELLQEVENMERMKNNPFDPDAFKPWLKTTRRVHRHTKNLMTQLEAQIEEYIAESETRISRFGEVEAKHEDVCRDLKLQLEGLRVCEEQEDPELDDEIIKLRTDLIQVENDVSQIRPTEFEVQEEVAKWTIKWENLCAQASVQDAEFEAMDEEEARLIETIAQLDGPFTKSVQKLFIQHITIRDEIIQDAWGVDLFAPDEAEAAGKPETLQQSI